MALFNQLTPLQRDVLDIQQLADQQADQFVGTVKRLADFIWRNPKYTPAEVLAALGTDAGKLFQLSAVCIPVVTAVTGVTPEIRPEGYDFIVNNDGTVTITAEPPAPPEDEPADDEPAGEDEGSGQES